MTAFGYIIEKKPTKKALQKNTVATEKVLRADLAHYQMNIKQATIDVKTIRPGDKLWHINSGFVQTPRAGFEISNQCPREYKAILATCIQNGWLKPIAYLRGSEATMEYLKC